MKKYIIFGILVLIGSHLLSQEHYLIPNVDHLGNERSIHNEIRSSNIQENVMYYNNHSDFAIDYNEITKKYIVKYLNYSWIDKIMGLGGFYFPLFEAKFNKYNLPIELKYLAVVESNLNPRAKSPVGASGLWQFMPATGKQYGLGKNQEVNLFYDPVASTESACKYLSRLYKLLGDWRLVLSAYNAGEGTVLKAIKKAGTKEYWKVRNFLPKETRAYVPSFYAVSYVFNFYREHNIKPRNFALSYSNVLISRSKEQIYINELKDKENYVFLNPQFIKGVIPKGAFYYSYNF